MIKDSAMNVVLNVEPVLTLQFVCNACLITLWIMKIVFLAMVISVIYVEFLDAKLSLKQ